jgi:hypothetical protein
MIRAEEQQVEAVCLDVLERFMTALNAHDAAAMDACMHFPHVRLAQARVTVYEAPGSNPMELFERLRREDGWDHSRWDERRLVQCSPEKAHFAVRYTRFRADGSVIGAYDALYILTRQQDGWGIQARSSFGP